MKVAVLSGKGGTGKTLVSVNLAAVASTATYLDCDIEAPNGHLFFKPDITSKNEVAVEIANVDNSLCNGCRKCIEFCRFNALSYVNNQLLVFEDLCHSCGGCMLVCPEKALSKKNKVVGELVSGYSEKVEVKSGFLKLGEASGNAIISELIKDDIHSDSLTIIDCPPGSSCSVMESIRDVDYCVLVAESTIFGLHNLKMVVDLVKIFNKPFGVVLNKTFDEDNPVESYCLSNNIEILTKIKFDQELGRINSNGNIAVRENLRYKELFENLLTKIVRGVDNETTVNP